MAEKSLKYRIKTANCLFFDESIIFFSDIVFQLFIDKSGLFVYYNILDIGCEKTIFFTRGRL